MKKYLLVVGVLMVFLNACNNVTTYESLESSLPTITVDGYGELSATPDEASISFGVVSEEKLLDKAYSKNTEAMNAIIQTVKQRGIEKKDIQTSSYSITPLYPVDERGRRLPEKLVGFRVNQQLTIVVRDISKVGVLIDTVVAQGANTFNGLSFDVSKRTELQRQAKIRAIEEAQEKARVLADSLGLKLGRILRVYETGTRPYQPKNVARFEMATHAAPDIEAGSLEISASCQIVYETIQ